MSIDFLVNKEIAEVLDTDNDNFSNYKTNIHIKVSDDKWVSPVRIEHMLTIRDYGTGNMGDFKTIDFLMNYGDVVYDLISNKDDLTVEVVNIPLSMSGNGLNTKRRTSTRRYRGVLNENSIVDPRLTNKESVVPTRENLNQLGLIHVQIQLIEESVYRLLMISCGLTYRQSTPMNALLSTYVHYLKMLGKQKNVRIESYCIRPGHNSNVRHQIQIPDGTMVKDLHNYIQNNEGGIYPTGIGRYIQDNVFYVYPLYDFESYKKNLKILNIINIPRTRFQGAEKTFRDEEKKLTILVTGESVSKDDGLKNQITEGNGVRFGNANNLFKTTVEKDNKILMDKASNLYEVSINKLKTGVNNVKMEGNVLTSNPFKQYTEMARRQGLQLDIDWTKGDADLLTPAMPVKFTSLSGSTVKTYYGVLLGVSENRIPTNAGMVTETFANTVRLSIFINRVEANE